MRRYPEMSSLPVLTLALSLLFATTCISPADAQAQRPSFDVDEPLPSLKRALAHTTTDSQRVEVATGFLKARENMEISYSTFRKGIWEFRTRHPDFYGNFFGDPFYATYDVAYFKMDRLRYLAALEVDPFGGLGSMFSCNPLWYDPAFGGWCRGTSFASADFFLWPDRSEHKVAGVTASFARVENPLYWGDLPKPRSDERPPTFSDSTPTLPPGVDEPHTASRSGDRSDSSEDENTDRSEESGVTTDDVQDLILLSNRVRLPDGLHHEIKEQAEELRRQEAILRLRRVMRKGTRGGTALSDRERFELAQKMAEGFSSRNEENLLSRVRRIEAEYETRFPRKDRPHFGEEDWRRTPPPDRPHRRSSSRVSPERSPTSSGGETTSSEGPTSSGGSGSSEGSPGSSEGAGGG